MENTLKLNLKKVDSLKELIIEVVGEYEEGQDDFIQLEKSCPDFAFYCDKNLNSLIKTLKYNGMDENEIVSFSMALYGPVIDFYEVGTNDDKFYVMAVGTR